LKKFRKISVLLAMVSLLGIIFGCSSNGTGDAENEEFVLKYSHVVPESHATHLASEEFKEEVEEKSDGRIKVEIYPNGELYESEREAVEATITGNLDMTIIGAPAISSFDSRFMVLDLPYLFNSEEEAFEALDGELGDELDDVMDELGLTNLGWGDNGFKNMAADKEVKQKEDFNNLSVRVMENKLYQDTFEELGASADSHPFGELYSALQQGVIDATDQPVSLMASNKFYEVLSDYTETEHVYASAPTFINKDKFEEMPEDLQDIMIEAGDHAINDSLRELSMEQNSEKLEEMEEEGLNVHEVSQEEKDDLREDVQPIYDKYEDDIGKDLIDMAESYSE